MNLRRRGRPDSAQGDKKMDRNQITEIIKQHAGRIAERAYPTLPMGNGEIEFTVSSEDGEYTEKMDSMHLSFAYGMLMESIAAEKPVALAQAALTLAMHEELRRQCCNSSADFYYESDGHYETGNTLSKNRERAWNAFPSRNDFRSYAQEVSK